VLDQKYPAGVVDHDRPHPEGHRAGKAPIEVKDTPNGRLKTSAKAINAHFFNKPLLVLPNSLRHPHG
jgi:hypothetical protein